ncbi:hypothetical protein [Neptuniibacter sp.]|uniref:hypothetical protein n=1 Tax=Neptuniibacter sp. TaxID=1962643 RepID=UPI00260C5ABA|nr:hypothetical protein [Neptuniibacter sp.]MCP4597945.1 hypothetical protein [Neptuniibacter sp.]
MTDLSTTLHEAKIKSVLLIDDAYDSAPTPGDLAIDDDEWTAFFDDITSEDIATIKSFYPNYDEVDGDDLINEAEFVEQLWMHRSDIRTELVSPLFERYEFDTNQDIEFLSPVIDQLKELGLECSTSGRSVDTETISAELIIIDLFLSSAQTDTDMDLSISILKRIIDARSKNPPLIILTSRNNRLETESSYFRDNAGLFESGFRFIPKNELSKPKFTRILSRLARHYTDTLKLSNFVYAWEKGLISASQRTTSLLRRLNISDFSQINQLLLKEEGEAIGNYLVDTFDNVLKHEVERERSIIDAAINLNELDLENYPPPNVTGSSDLQELVHKLLYIGPERLELKQEEGPVVHFGDLLSLSNLEEAGEQISDTFVLFSQRVEPSNILLVVTPACDLQRAGSKNILLLVGSPIELTSDNWDKKSTKERTPIFYKKDDDKKYWVKWDLKHIETISHSELKSLLQEKTVNNIGRMRESYALELQQLLLSDIGRVGQIATMPGTFNVGVNIYLVGSEDQKFFSIAEGLEGTCFVNKDRVKKLVLPEEICEEICSKLAEVDIDSVSEHSKERLDLVVNSDELLVLLEAGIDIPSGTGLTQIKSLRQLNGNQPLILGYITKGVTNNTVGRREALNCGVVIEIIDNQ